MNFGVPWRPSENLTDKASVTTLGTTLPKWRDAPSLRCDTLGEPSNARRRFRWLTRPRRVLLALAAVWVINVFDLGYTMLESMTSVFVELNPVAAHLVGQSPVLLVLYKALLIVLSSAVLLVYRRRRITELACWLLLSVYICVAGCWQVYYAYRLASFDDPAVNFDPLLGCCIP